MANLSNSLVPRPSSHPEPPLAIHTLTGNDLRGDVLQFLARSTFDPVPAEVDTLITKINHTYGDDRGGLTFNSPLIRPASMSTPMPLTNKSGLYEPAIPSTSAPLETGNQTPTIISKADG
ncbi:MAG: hypothetical protein M2R45_03961 [Verrucomicrobia subdivision 3 bacterium]|nr:hypothetical protein [Limisphaerales bacterium]MCS1415519.1 hypothetical protein [Limisphaerales bacterium]